MMVAAKERETVLTAEGGNPEIIGRNGFPDSSDLRDELSIVKACFLHHLEYRTVKNKRFEPKFVTLPMPRPLNAKAILA
jgi:hypothetical protein